MNDRKIEIESKLLAEFLPKIKEDGTIDFEFAIPIFQRSFVWKQNDIKDLWDSIYRNYPIGSFIIWETEKNLPKHRNISENITFTETQRGNFKYILDGQQRISSLIASAIGAKIKRTQYLIYFNLKNAYLENQEDDIEVKKKIPIFFTEKDLLDISNEDKEFIFELKELIEFNPNIYAKLFEKGEKELAKFYNDVCNRLKTNYKLSIINLKNVPIKEVCELFTRVNQKGKKLGTIELLVANTYQQDVFYLRDKLDQLNNELSEVNYEDMDEVIFVRILSMIKKGACKESVLFTLNNQDFIELWEEVSNSYKKAIKYLKKLNIAHPKILPYKPMVVSLAYFFYKLGEEGFSDELNKLVEKWFWVNSFQGRYQGATNEIIQEDCEWFDRVIKGNLNLNTRLKLDLNPELILNEELKLSSGFCKAILCLLAHKRPFDFTNHNEIDIYDILIKSKTSQLHHIFPLNSVVGRQQNKQEINSVANVCFLPRSTNLSISNDEPKDYFVNKTKNNKEHFKRDMLTQLIPYSEDSGIFNSDFKVFLRKRAEMIIQEMKVLIDYEVDIKD